MCRMSTKTKMGEHSRIIKCAEVHALEDNQLPLQQKQQSHWYIERGILCDNGWLLSKRVVYPNYTKT